MVTENLQETLNPSVDGASSIWDARAYRGRVFSIEWSGLAGITATFELQVSTDQVNWDCYGGTSGEFVLDAASGYQIIEVTQSNIPYWRLRYTANGNVGGQIVLRTYGQPLFKNVG